MSMKNQCNDELRTARNISISIVIVGNLPGKDTNVRENLVIVSGSKTNNCR